MARRSPATSFAEIRTVLPMAADVGMVRGTLNQPEGDATKSARAAPLYVSLPVWPASNPPPLTTILDPGEACCGAVTLAVVAVTVTTTDRARMAPTAKGARRRKTGKRLLDTRRGDGAAGLVDIVPPPPRRGRRPSRSPSGGSPDPTSGENGRTSALEARCHCSLPRLSPPVKASPTMGVNRRLWGHNRAEPLESPLTRSRCLPAALPQPNAARHSTGSSANAKQIRGRRPVYLSTRGRPDTMAPWMRE